MPTNPVHRRDWISYQLRLRGLSFRAVARREGVSHQAVCAAARGSSSRPLQEALAAALDLTPQGLFPELYDGDGNRLGRTRAPQRSTPPPDATRSRPALRLLSPVAPPHTVTNLASDGTRNDPESIRHATPAR